MAVIAQKRHRKFSGEHKPVSYSPVPFDDPRLAFTGLLVAGHASDTQDTDLLPWGSAFFVAPYLALTARHVIDEIAQKFHGCLIHQITGDIAFGIDFGVQHPRYGLMRWEVTGYGYTPTIDITALIVKPREPATLPDGFTWHLPTLSLAQPLIGLPITALGFPQSSHRLDADGNAKIVIKPHESKGLVTQVYDLARDRAMLPHPCFEATARFDGGMSGGPVFSSNGCVVGAVGSSIDFGDVGGGDIGYVSAIWPAVGIELARNAEPYADIDSPRTLQQLVDSGSINAVNRMTSVSGSKVTLSIPDPRPPVRNDGRLFVARTDSADP